MLCSITLFYRAVYGIRWRNIVKPDNLQTTIWRMHNACCIRKATHTHTHTHTQYVILIAFPLQQRLQESALVLRYTYIACLGIYSYFLLPLIQCA